MDTSTLIPFVTMLSPYIDWTLALTIACIAAVLWLIFPKIVGTYVKMGIVIAIGLTIGIITAIVQHDPMWALRGGASGVAALMGTAYIIMVLKKMNGNQS